MRKDGSLQDGGVGGDGRGDFRPLRLTSTDWFVALGLLAATAIWIVQNYHSGYVPVEDAAMLLRYAQHFAQGYGIRWNIHQPPVDGATDFLFTVAIGWVARILHIGVIPASRMLNLAAEIVSVLAVYLGGRMLGGNRWVAAACASYLIVGPAMQMTMGCFGAPVFAFLLLGCWLCGLNYALRRQTWGAAFAMALLGLLAGLTRPEGVLVSGILLVAALYLAEAGGSVWVRPVAAYAAMFGIFGGAYFVWHWRYFGYPLPNPYYVKGDGHLYPGSAVKAVRNLANLLAPLLFLVPLGWLSPKTRRLTTALAGVLAAFAAMWILLNDWNNAFMRFQYAIVPAALVTIPALAQGGGRFLRQEQTTRASRVALGAAGLLAVMAGGLYARRMIPPYVNLPAGMKEFAGRLQPFAAKGYTIVVTEAGTLPLYSEWQTIDGLGLNDRYMAHNGHRLSSEYLDRFHPEVMMVHVDNAAPVEQYRRELAGDPSPDGSSWGNMGFINWYARARGYTLAAAWGSDVCNLHMYWVRPGFADYEQILALLRQHPYLFLDNGQVSTDFREHMEDVRDCEHP